MLLDTMHVYTYTHFAFIGFERQFDILKENVSTQGLKYDHLSVMHFNSKVFGKQTFSTIVSLKYPGRLGHASHPTFHDFLHLTLTYCQGRLPRLRKLDIPKILHFNM